MLQKRTEINKIRGERLRKVIRKSGMTQEAFAERIGYSQIHISYVVNGKRNLSQEVANAVVKMLPEVRIGWLLGYDDFETVEDAINASAIEASSNRKATRQLLEFAAKQLGYQVKRVENIDVEDEDIVDNDEPGEADTDDCWYTEEVPKTIVKGSSQDEAQLKLIKGISCIEITAQEALNFEDELIRYAAFSLSGLLHKKNDTRDPFR